MTEGVAHKLKHEFLQVLPPTIFFFVAFNLIGLTSALLASQHGIEINSFAAATVGALLVGKVVLIADKLPFVNRFPEKPLIYNVVWKTVIYVLAALLVRYVEHVVRFLGDHGGVIGATAHLFSEVVWTRFLAVQIWLVVLFLIYASMRELIRVVGRDQVLRMFFGRVRSPAG